VTGTPPFNSDIFTGENFLPFAATNRLSQDYKPKNKIREISISNSGISNHFSTPGLGTGHST
jgi:hypothetical protein